MDSLIKTNQPAPDFSLPDLNRRQHALIDYRNTIVIVNFWSAECPWVARTDPEVRQAMAGWGDAVTLLLVASNENEPPELLARVAKERGFSTVLRDKGGRVADLYDAQATPHFFVIDSQGVLRYRGAFDDVTFRQRKPTVHYLIDAVNALIDGAPPPVPETPAYGCTIVQWEE